MARPARTTATRLVRRLIAALLVAAWILPPSPGPVWAEHAPDHQPVARLQVDLKRIHVEDDEDWFGEGEIEGEVWLSRCNQAMEQCTAVGSTGGQFFFNADSGDTYTA